MLLGANLDASEANLASSSATTSHLFYHFDEETRPPILLSFFSTLGHQNLHTQINIYCRNIHLLDHHTSENQLTEANCAQTTLPDTPALLDCKKWRNTVTPSLTSRKSSNSSTNLSSTTALAKETLQHPK